MKCQDIEVGTTILMELDPTVDERIMARVEEQSKEYSKLSSNMGRMLTNLTKIQHDNPQAQQQREPDKEPKIKKELCPDTLTKENNPIEFRKFQRDFIVYYKESYMEQASPECQKHYLLKCLDAKLGEQMLAITDATAPIFDTHGNPTKSCLELLTDVTNSRKDFFPTDSRTATVHSLHRQAEKHGCGGRLVQRNGGRPHKCHGNRWLQGLRTNVTRSQVKSQRN